jgi:hypothetical protein
MHPPTVQPSGVPAAVAPSRPDRPRFLGFNPLRSTWRLVEGLTRQALATPLGFTLQGHSGESLGGDFALPPLTRFARPHDFPPGPTGAPEYQSAPARPHPDPHACTWFPHEATLLGFSHHLIPHIQASELPGYEFTSH